MSNIFNFSAGPAMLPPKVLKQAQTELLDWKELGTSVMEVSHRSKHFMDLAQRSIENLRKLYAIPDNYQILFTQGGARGQFSAIPMNLLGDKGKALYLTSGYWSHSAAKEARLFAEIDEINILTEQNGQTTIKLPDLSTASEQYDYVHYCPNETISGIEIFDIPDVGDAVLVADMSSNILSRQIDISRFGMIYAGAQKNLGPSGITLIIIRDDLIGKAKMAVPSIWNYQILKDFDSMFNTPPTFAWYLCALVFEQLLADGGLEPVAQHNQTKAQLLYQAIDDSDFYHNTVAPQYRSLMNVTFTTNNDELNALFVAEADKAGLRALKGHKVIGGMRASIYNAMPLEGVKALIDFMHHFEQKYKTK
ncbi:3-phosphoserine/phosphohydroxythreonine transaminase [Mergibacter septicus]|uniref:3-phosphoserine/phosphohydroxythreonine transaminase n=1 Tax=Mergibacter septicus TaxID=221402 RepID=UPI0021C2E7A8|nr:3-phosphoserine/phosphohydroxythreonine transaminase [Mergibacter septicus]UTU47389.1 3-phosphoserine/phosphohydroxythreonine transaminase [Mergibacter septicus]